LLCLITGERDRRVSQISITCFETSRGVVLKTSDVGQRYFPGARKAARWAHRKVNTEQLKARMRDGVLQITIPLDESARPRRIPIEE